MQSENKPNVARCTATRLSKWAKDGKTMQCERLAGHNGKHVALAGFIMFPWSSSPPKLTLVK